MVESSKAKMCEICSAVIPEGAKFHILKREKDKIICQKCKDDFYSFECEETIKNRKKQKGVSGKIWGGSKSLSCINKLFILLTLILGIVSFLYVFAMSGFGVTSLQFVDSIQELLSSMRKVLYLGMVIVTVCVLNVTVKVIISCRAKKVERAEAFKLLTGVYSVFLILVILSWLSGGM